MTLSRRESAKPTNPVADTVLRITPVKPGRQVRVPLSDARHPIEILHHGRDEIQRAVSMIEQRGRPNPDELNAAGSAVVTTLAALQQLADALTHKLYEYTEEEINQRREQDDPVDDYRKAVDRAQHLRGVLSTAFADADQYWAAIQRVHEHTEDGKDSDEQG